MDIDFGVDDFFIGPFPSFSAASGQQDAAAIVALGMPRGLNKPQPFVHSVVVYDGTVNNDSLYVVANGGVGSIRLSGDIVRNYTNVVLFQFHGHNGHDYFDAQYSNIPVTAFGGNGNDLLKGGAFNDRLVGDAGIDTLFGNGSNDILEGGSGQDYLDGGSGNDDLYGNLASNLSSDGAQDWLLGGSGFDEAWGELNDIKSSIEAFYSV
jgi:Ca2+-binding RTX toxin-like protein